MRTVTDTQRRQSAGRRTAASVPIWIWIIGGIIVALTALTGAYMQLSNIGCQAQKQQAINQYTSINEDVRFLCQQAPGSRQTKTVSFGCGVRAIFADDTRGEPPAKVPQHISESDWSRGKYVCLTFGDNHYGCAERQCTVNMTYIGEPLEGTDMYQLGKRDNTFEFELTMRRLEDQEIVIEATHVP